MKRGTLAVIFILLIPMMGLSQRSIETIASHDLTVKEYKKNVVDLYLFHRATPTPMQQEVLSFISILKSMELLDTLYTDITSISVTPENPNAMSCPMNQVVIQGDRIGNTILFDGPVILVYRDKEFMNRAKERLSLQERNQILDVSTFDSKKSNLGRIEDPLTFYKIIIKPAFKDTLDILASKLAVSEQELNKAKIIAQTRNRQLDSLLASNRAVGFPRPYYLGIRTNASLLGSHNPMVLSLSSDYDRGMSPWKQKSVPSFGADLHAKVFILRKKWGVTWNPSVSLSRNELSYKFGKYDNSTHQGNPAGVTIVTERFSNVAIGLFNWGVEYWGRQRSTNVRSFRLIPSFGTGLAYDRSFGFLSSATSSGGSRSESLGQLLHQRTQNHISIRSEVGYDIYWGSSSIGFKIGYTSYFGNWVKNYDRKQLIMNSLSHNSYFVDDSKLISEISMGISYKISFGASPSAK